MEDFEGFLMGGIPELQMDSDFDAWCHFQSSEMCGFDIMSGSTIEFANLSPEMYGLTTTEIANQEEQQQDKQNEPDCDDEARIEEEATKSCTNMQVSHWEETNIDEEEEEEIKADDTKKGIDGLSCKNLISERNRRKRINQQLLTLMSIVPDIKKMGERAVLEEALASFLQLFLSILMSKRAVLEEALAYLQSILEQTELEHESARNNSKHIPAKNSASVSVNLPPAQVQETIRPCITEIDVERMDGAQFILKVRCDKDKGALVRMQRAIESLGLGLETTCVSVNQFGQGYMLTTAFLRAKRRGVATEEKLKHRFKVTAMRMGFRLQDP